MAGTYLQSELVDRQTDTLNWSKVADYILDRDGPLLRPYRPMGFDFASVCIFDHLRDIAEQYPDKLAVSDGINRLTYSELFSAVESLSRRIATDVVDGQAVGILLASSVWYPVALLASMAAGRPSVPFDTRDPGWHIGEIAVAARLSAVIGAGKVRHAGLSQKVQWIDVAADLVTTDSRTPPSHLPDVVSVDAPAIVLYTSGSTGRPKGIVNSQRSLLRRVQQYVDACHINSEDVVLLLTGPATIAGCRDIFAALLTGATLHLLEVEAVGLRVVRRRMQTEGVTIAYVVPTLLRALMADDDPADAFRSLRVVRIGGEKVAWTDIALLRKNVSNACLIQIGYSSTESTGSQWFVPRNLSDHGASVPVGWLLPGIAFAIVNEEGCLLEPGDSGELLIKSPDVSLGHWENGAVVPSDSDPDVRIFATGDLVQLDDLGLLRIIGRKGRQLKINGRRVEPAELEHVLRCVPAVEDAVAIATAANELVAFAVPRRPTGMDLAAELGQIVKQKLPPPLRPLRLHTIADIPRLPGGKVDVAKLRELDLSARKTAPNPQPANAGHELTTHQLVQDAWTKILNTRETAGSWDEAGGDSLKLLHCVIEIESATGQELSAEAFTVDMTVAEMVKAIVSGQTTGQVVRPQADASPILFLLPGSVGYGPSMASFAAAMGKVARVTPIKYPDLRNILDGKNTVTAMAAVAVEQIHRTQPVGHVRLLGHSLGGVVAFEVAARLLEAGRSVKFLGILDTSIVNERRDYWETLTRTLLRMRTNRVNAYRLACRVLAKGTVAIGCEARLAWFLDRYSRRKFDATCFRIKLELQEVLRSRAFFQWLAEPKPVLPIAGTVFRCDREGVPQSLGWDRNFASLDVVRIAGGHLDLVVEPHLATNRVLIEKAVAQTYASVEYCKPEARS
ncbi:AMP-binding protein [Tardiphaga sp.]|uniref:non-ribosomal peptide synthetase n=1 Tax=Tardiphaga sp. TaxID=1926292 RepID=UPI0026168889|nr:AMP-binding protein [Tardiphaga sp.]MDB5619849.1 AMP-dependent synthetase [Tardiphaga sp.]